MKKALALSFTFSSLLIGDCVSGKSREATAAERVFATRVFEALKEAMPAAPAGFIKPAAPSFDPVPKSLCAETAPGAFKIGFAVTYERAARVLDQDTPEGKENRKISDEVAQLRQLPPAKEAEWKKMQEPYLAKNKAAREAERAGDRAKAAALRAEATKLYEPVEAYLRAYQESIAPQVKAMFERQSKLGHLIREKYQEAMQLEFWVNDAYGNTQSNEQVDIVLLGPAKIARPAVKVQQIRIHLNGPAMFRKVFAEAIDQAKLKALLGS